MRPGLWLDAAVAVGRPGTDGPKWTATGFLLRTTAPDVPALHLVTNRHVVADRHQLLLRCNTSDGTGVTMVGVDLTGEAGPIHVHPDPAVDVAVIPVSEAAMRDHGIEPVVFRTEGDVARLADLQERGVVEGDPVVVPGYPLELLDPNHNDAIVRSGTIARLRDCVAGRSPTFLLDVFVFPGNSGSPVLLVHGDEALLMGIVAAYVPYRDVAVSRHTGRERLVLEENSGLTRAHPVDQVLETIAAGAAAGGGGAGY